MEQQKTPSNIVTCTLIEVEEWWHAAGGGLEEEEERVIARPARSGASAPSVVVGIGRKERRGGGRETRAIAALPLDWRRRWEGKL